jgi:hypothetical protein
MNRFSSVGIYFFGVAMAAFGVIQLIIRDFLLSEFQVPAGVPLRGVLMILSSFVFLFAAVAIFFRFRRQLALLLVAGMYLVILLTVHLPALVTHIYTGSDWAVLFEGLMVGSGALIIAAQLPDDSGLGSRWIRIIQAGAWWGIICLHPPYFCLRSSISFTLTISSC